MMSRFAYKIDSIRAKFSENFKDFVDFSWERRFIEEVEGPQKRASKVTDRPHLYVKNLLVFCTFPCVSLKYLWVLSFLEKFLWEWKSSPIQWNLHTQINTIPMKLYIFVWKSFIHHMHYLSIFFIYVWSKKVKFSRKTFIKFIDGILVLQKFINCLWYAANFYSNNFQLVRFYNRLKCRSITAHFTTVFAGCFEGHLR